MYEGSTLYYTLAILSAAYVINSVVTSEAYKLRKISTIGGSSWPVLSLWGAVRILRRGPAIIEEAYAKHKGSAFKFAEMRWWHVMVTGPLVDELFRAPEDMLSSMAAMRQMIQLRYTLGERMAYNNYFVGIVRMQFTRTLDQMYPSMREEIIAAFNDHLVLKEDEWTAVPLMASALPIVSRLSTHMFVGPSACRIPEFNQLMSDFAVTIHKTAILINLFPAVLHPIVGPLFSPLKSNIAKCASFIGPMIQERLDMRKQDGGDWEKPMDLLQLLIDAAPEEDLTVPGMCALSFLAGIGAIHTSSMSFVFALFHIASKPDEYLRALREEVDAVVAKYGWNRASLNEMRKLESFLMESQRLSGLGASNGIRLAVKDFYFSDGTFIPKGTMVSVPPNAIHKDEALYPDAETFKPWRFVQTDEGKGGKTSLVTTHPDYIPFGHGRHACPGRFFAVTELKSMIAYVVATYDVKMENEGVLPSKQSMGVFVFPDVKARVMFRKRQS